MLSRAFPGSSLSRRARRSNVEANLAYVFPEDGPVCRAMEDTLPPCDDRIEGLDAVLWEPVDERLGEDPGGSSPLPTGFREALFEPKDDGGVLMLHLGTPLPERWRITEPTDGAAVYSSDDWHDAGRPATIERPWVASFVPNAVDVKWWDESSAVHSAPWPVNVRDLGQLRPPEELRKLSLETLVEILGSRLPLHVAVARARRRQRSTTSGEELPPEVDPLRRVRTETFLLQRTRRVARALEHLVERLNRPVVHRDGLLWRLRGPVGPLALARALIEAAGSPGEACFLLSEVVLALRRVDVKKIAVGVDPKEVRAEVDAVKAEVDALARRYLGDETTPRPMADYVARALEEVRQ